MSEEITTAYIKQFSQGITHLAQQKRSRLRSAVRVEPGIVGDRDFFDQLGLSSMTALSSRHADTDLSNTPHRRRMVTMKTYSKADMVDKRDEVRILNNPINAYTQSFAQAANRQMDQTIIDVFTATASTGVDGTGTATFDTTNFQTTNVGGLDLAKIVEAKAGLVGAENDPEVPMYFVYAQNQLSDVLLDPTITSNDYNSVRLLVAGSIDQFMGFTWIHSELLPVSGTVRSCYAWSRDSMLLGISQDTEGFVDRRPDKNQGMQVQYMLDVGATRMDETGVYEVRCDEA